MKWLLLTLAEYFIIGLCFAISIYFPNPFIWILSLLIIGTRQHALGVIGHWSVHNIPGKYSKFLQILCMDPLGVDIEKYKFFHFSHHKYLGNSVLDPEVWFFLKFRKSYERYSFKETILDLSGMHLYQAFYLFRPISSNKSKVILGLLTSGLYFFIGPVSLLWPISLILVLPALNRLRMRTEHDHLHFPGVTFKVENPSLWKRLVYLPHKTWKHYEHHEHPTYI